MDACFSVTLPKYAHGGPHRDSKAIVQSKGESTVALLESRRAVCGHAFDYRTVTSMLTGESWCGLHPPICAYASYDMRSSDMANLHGFEWRREFIFVPPAK